MKRIKVKSPTSGKPLIALLVLLVILVVVLILELTDTTHLLHKTVSTIKSSHPKTSSQQSSPDNNTSPKEVDSESSNSTKNTAPNTASSNSTPPATPSGTFVSNHHPSLSGQDGVPSTERSVCVTTPGATCYIQFTQGNVIKKLDSQTAGSNGSVYWDWDVSKDSFDTGSWQVAAIASMNGQTVKSDDAQQLVVQP